DQVEAMTMADKIVVLRAGVIEQVGTPLELYGKPCNLFVAGFIGSPKMNLVSGPIAAQYDATTVGVRPEHIEVSAEAGDWPGVIGVSEHLGSDTFFHVTCAGLGDPVTVRVGGEIALHYGDKVFLTPGAEHIHKFDHKGLRIE
ncbi:MAG: TOBE domain-containing protein, partial [Rhodospirillales bacterium]|nr:TOBE domain-containing protein [Rhodospirillales bacterium]